MNGTPVGEYKPRKTLQSNNPCVNTGQLLLISLKVRQAYHLNLLVKGLLKADNISLSFGNSSNIRKYQRNIELYLKTTLGHKHEVSPTLRTIILNDLLGYIIYKVLFEFIHSAPKIVVIKKRSQAYHLWIPLFATFKCFSYRFYSFWRCQGMISGPKNNVFMLNNSSNSYP